MDENQIHLIKSKMMASRILDSEESQLQTTIFLTTSRRQKRTVNSSNVIKTKREISSRVKITCYLHV